jgi:two-component system, NtrC family, sensor kinase
MIKYLPGFTLLFLSTVLFAQQRDTFKFELNDKNPWIILDSAWKFNVGDHPDWAKREFNDSSWRRINLSQDLSKLPQIPTDGQVVWFRIKLLNQSSTNRQLVLRIYQTGASEVYLDGGLIHRLGVVSTNQDSVAYYNPKRQVLSFPLKHNVEQILAIRFVNQPVRYPKYTTLWKSMMSISVVLNDHTSNHDIVAPAFNNGMLFVTGVSSILGLLYLSFYLFFQSQKINLYFSIACFLQFAAAAGYFFINTSNNFPAGFGVFNNVLSALCTMLLMFCCYKIFDIKTNWVFRSIFFFGLINIPIFAFFVEATLFIFIVIGSGEILRVSSLALRRKKRGAWIILTSAIVPFVFWLVYPFAVSDFIYMAIFIPYVVLMPYISLAVFLGHSYGLTNQSLHQKMIEVEQLSGEKEKLLSEQNVMLEKQVMERTTELNKSLDTLRSTQSQLIQSEKMASLGELTAGIAHEIQNPLNFVNNFSEVNKELLSEMKEEIEKGNLEEAKSLAGNVIDNQEKINEHGKRADAIVKGMLQHSRSSSGIREPTNINTLTEEYFKLAYHGFRAKDKTFNVALKTNFDESIATVNVIPQDIGRVILNLLNNAFYAVSEKKKQVGDAYEPIVSISTRKSRDNVLISVQDNGIGIEAKIIDKVFQPFFTTKPTGQGTGLGLSLSYDIVKALSGTIKINANQNEGAEFVVELPVA